MEKEKNTSLVSVVIPVYNSQKYVEKCIRSVMAQTHSDLEILVIDDGSTDGSGATLDRLAAADDRIRVLHQENAGVAAARNAGIDVASGEYLAFLDGDDYIGKDYIANLYRCAQESQAEMVICGLTYVDEKGAELKKIIPGPYVKGEREEWAFRISAVCSHFYRRHLWEKYHVRFCMGERGEDMPVSLFFSTVCDRIVTLPKADYFYVQHASSASHNFKGLAKYDPPYRGLEACIQKIQSCGSVVSPEFYELFVLRILGTCYFSLGCGASAEKARELCDYIQRILNTYFPNYYKNRLAGLHAGLEIPMTQKIAVRLLILLTRSRLLYPVLRMMR